MLKKIGSYLVVLVIGAAIGTWFDAKHTIEEKVVYKDRVKTEIREVIKEAPDGTKVTERITYRNEKKDKKVSKKESMPVKKDWGVSIKYDLIPSGQPVWTVEVQRRVFGDIYAGAYGRTDGVAGVGVTVFF
jgi:hypothetical protein